MFEPTHSLDDIVPDARDAFEQLLLAAEEMGLHPQVGLNGAGRTCATQQMLKAQGPGVTAAGMCRSFHVFGRALDIDISPSTCENYTKLGELWESWGGTWGGRWMQFGPCGDARHFQWSEGLQAVPESICPREVTLAECEDIRATYLAAAFSEQSSRIWILLFVGGMTALGWWWLQRKH
jgi:hypothetical protein